MNKMADDDANMSNEEIRSPVHASGKLRGGEIERSRSRSRSFSRGRRRSSYWSPHRRSPHRRRRNERDDRWRRRDRSTTTRDRSLSTGRTASSAPQVALAIQRHVNTSEIQCKDGDEVVLVSSPTKPKLQRMRETLDEYESDRNTNQKPLETVKMDNLKHQPALSFADQSTEGFIDFEDVPSSLAKSTTIKLHKSVAFATGKTLPEVTIGQETHPIRMRHVSDDADMNAADNDFTTSHTFEAPQARSCVPEISYSNLIPVAERRWKVKTLSLPNLSIPAVSMARHNESWGDDDWEASADSAPVPLSQVTAPCSLAQYDDIFAEPPDRPSMPPSPLYSAPSHGPVVSSSIPGPISPVDTIGPPRTREQIYTNYLLECDRVENEDTKRRKRQRTMKYEVFDEEVEVILARMSFNVEHVTYAAQEVSSKPGQPILRPMED